MNLRSSLLALALAAVAAMAFASCDVNEYCVTCATDDGGGGNGDGRGPDSSTPDGMDDGDGGGTPDGLCAPQPEACNKLDDDCDGKVDESTTAEPLPRVGEECGGTMGVCRMGVLECVDGELKCSGVEPSGEICDGLDNDCDGTPDDGDPGGGGPCTGLCGMGINKCVAGRIECEVNVQPSPEICDGIDNDCRNGIDDGLEDMGPCGTDTGLCVAGHSECQFGSPVCVGSTGPRPEVCDRQGDDSDCDGNPSNGFDLVNDPRNCGTCGTVCAFPNAIAGCTNRVCVIAECLDGFYDNNPTLPGCEYACDFRGSQEACNGADEDCDGRLDEGAIPPPICATQGECGAGPGGRTPVVAVCTRTAAGWDCPYDVPNRDTSTDTNGDLVPETECDGLDNDCDGRVDESHPQKGQACNDGGVGACRRNGTLGCNPSDENGALICQFSGPAPTPSQNDPCDGIDNNCNGVVDDNASTGNILGQDWIDIGGGRQIMKYEASRPDARSNTVGTLGAHACSRTGVLPWINIRQPEAEAVCASMGARLCTEQEWHRACSAVVGKTYPVAEPAADNGKMFFEAEDYFAKTTATDGGVVRAWVPDSSAGFSGISGMRASPNTGASNTGAQAIAESPRLDFRINVTTAGQHFIWVKGWGPRTADNRIHVGVDGAAVGTADNIDFPANTWTWVGFSGLNQLTINVTTGVHNVNIWMGDDGVKVDALIVTRDAAFTPAAGDATGPGGTWAYQSNPNTSQPTVCNGDAFDTNSGAGGDQDDIVPTGTAGSPQPTQCSANWTTILLPADTNRRIFDLSGNVREWTAERLPGANPIRGGTSNNLEDGLQCDLAFTLADDQFFFSNVGFRCCR